MAGETTIPILPCGDLEEALAFYDALGFAATYRQRRPNPYAVVAREDIQVHLFGIEGYDPAAATGNVIVAVPDPDALYESFAAGLRAAYGRLPSAGIPRILRPRRRFGTVRGFSVVDPGGNWLRVSRLGDTEEEANRDRPAGLARVVENAARQGDARGADDEALRLLDAGLARFGDAPPADRARALLYRAELGVRLGDGPLAEASLADARTVVAGLPEAGRAALAPDLAHAEELVAGLPPGGDRGMGG
jgi:catechol 2,3-dioxygenase-like lactoylglutathione lyase family enzyme